MERNLNNVIEEILKGMEATIKELQARVNKLEVENKSLKGSLELEKKLVENYREYFKPSDSCPF